MSVVLYEHQKRILELFTQHDRFLLLAEVGTGKTLPSLIHLSNLIMAGEVESALIMAPLSGLGAWQRDTAKLPENRQRLIERAVTYCNYDKVSRRGGKWQKQMWRSWDCMILDESHAISKPTSNRTQYFVGKGKALALASKARFYYELTGTLINNSRLEDLWAHLRAIYLDNWPLVPPEYTDMTWAKFKMRYLITVNLPGSYAEIVRGYRHRDELLELLAACSYRVLKKDCLDLPEELPDEIVTVPFAPGKNAAPFEATTRELYDEALDSYVDALDMVMDNPLTRRLRIRQIAAGHIKESDTCDESGRKVKGAVYQLKSLKTAYALELIENNLPNKTVVGYQFRATCDALSAALTRKKVPFVVLNGDQSDKNIWQKFQSDPTIKVIIVQYQSGAQAIDLFASSYTIFMEPTDSSWVCTQFRARTHRNGQTQPCSYVWLLTEGSVEEEMYKRLQDHKDFDDEAWREVALARKRARGER